MLSLRCLSHQHGTNKLFTRRKGSGIRRCSTPYRSGTPGKCLHGQKIQLSKQCYPFTTVAIRPFFFPGTQLLILINTVMNRIPLADFTISLTCIQNPLYNNTPALSSDTQHSTTE